MKQPKELMTVSVPPELKVQLKARATQEGRSISNLVTLLLSKEVKKGTKAAYTG